MLPHRGTKGANKIISLCLLCLFVGCHIQPDPDVKIVPEVEPHRVGQVTVTVRVTQPSTGKPITGANVRLEGNMSHAGMAAVFAETTEIEPGLYRTNMEFTMAGDWLLSVYVTLKEGLHVDRQFEIKGVAPA
jgi:YtkA-like